MAGEQRSWEAGDGFGAGRQSALVLTRLVGRPAATAENHSVLKDQWREADFLAGYLCGLSGICDMQGYFQECMPSYTPYSLKDSIDSMSEGLMHGELIDNLIMGLFNLNFAMTDYEETLASHGCTRLHLGKEVREWKEVRHGITHESMSVINAKIGEHLADAHASS